MLESQVGDAVEELEKENSKDTVALQKLQDRKAKLGGYAAVSEYVFAGMYFLVRVVGGTYVTGTWLSRTIPLFLHDVQLRFANPNQESFALHDEGAAGIAILAITVIQLLQYVWFSEIVKRGLGLTGGEEEKKEKTAIKKKNEKHYTHTKRNI
ncbi:hypothetical protein AGDE_15798 [Angomonas deanei]|uniref:TLC domain containing protein, putative n=1 Tax=Angomonas deanei TaxID=59799 RepID=A0A7G2CN43_9TRYP|nr:hypothetical protein AGDE_15798 [Angomonas deanei]CAD2221270.1 TLC domain containing protein, putative [Angomonas deanei]|eukprot:EPY18394.1 hypothetical protein AGDE_15798 [Angomonas deanei]